MIIVGVDTGGTFTDFVYRDEKGKWGVYKVLSTPWNPAEAVLHGIQHITDGRQCHVVHGSTVATNAILERKGARTALITNKGYEDIIEIGRQNRHRLYDLKYKKRSQLVPEELRFGIDGRINAQGEIVKEIDLEETQKLSDILEQKQVESIAMCLLFSFLKPEEEAKLADYFRNKGFFVSVSSEILSEFREYERTSTTVINAYVSPKMTRYIGHILSELKDGKLRIMQSNGGSISANTAMKEPVRTILSGPAGGVVGAFEFGRMTGFDKLITFDMGGTSTDVALIDGKLPLTVDSSIDGFPVKVPMLAIHTVGAGGGSIAYRDPGGSLRVGPISAGADPGPICYGKGDRITVTDANLFLGRLVPEHFLGGNMELHVDRIKPYFEKMAKEMGLTPVELAEGVLNVANTSMERAIRVISVERGYDPREFTLFSFGGAGGMHAAFLANLLKIPRVLIPKNPGILSAIGMLVADVIKDYSQTVMENAESCSVARLNELFSNMEEIAKEDLRKEGVPEDQMVLERHLDMRYRGQSYELIVALDSENFVEDFHNLHEKTYGYANRGKPVEIVNLRLRARGMLEKPPFRPLDTPVSEIDTEAIIGKRPVIFDGKKFNTTVYKRDFLRYGNKFDGPAIIVEYSSTTVVPPGWHVHLDSFENLILTCGENQ